MPDPETFERYFHERADLAEHLYRDGWRHEAVLIATVALDALANIREHDHKLKRINGAERLSQFVQRYAGDPDTRKIAVVFLAEDILAIGPARLHEVARRLLLARDVNPAQEATSSFEFQASPFAHLDCEWDELVNKEPALAPENDIEKLARERYTYPALLYSLTRCAVVHSLTRGTRTSDFSRDEPDDEISYLPPYEDAGRMRPISQKVGLRRITTWLRTATTNYAAECEHHGIRPADGFDANAKSLDQLYGAWKKVT